MKQTIFRNVTAENNGYFDRKFTKADDYALIQLDNNYRYLGLNRGVTGLPPRAYPCAEKICMN